MGESELRSLRMKSLLALTFLLAFLALALTEPDTDRDLELLRDQLEVRDKREPAMQRKKVEKRKRSKAVRRKKPKNQKKTKKGKKRAKKRANTKNRRNRNKKKKKGSQSKYANTKNRRNRKKKKTKEGSQRMGRNTTTCSDSTTVSSDCLQDAVDVLKYLGNQVRTFNRKFARIKSFNKTVGNKLGKKGVFEETASWLLVALGGNISNAACGETGSRRRTGRDKNTAVTTYKTLNNCSTAIKEACSMPNTTLSDEDITTFNSCKETFNKTSVQADDCRTNSKYANNGTAACICWSKIVASINKVKQSGACNATDTNNGVKESKNTCMATFSACRKAEDSAVQLVYTCGSGEVANQTKSTS